jgi:hypothetical protein
MYIRKIKKIQLLSDFILSRFYLISAVIRLGQKLQPITYYLARAINKVQCAEQVYWAQDIIYSSHYFSLF